MLRQAKSLSRVKVSAELRKEVTANSEVLGQQGIGAGGNMFAVHGVAVSVDGVNEAIDSFKVVQTVRAAARRLRSLSALGVPKEQGIAWLRPQGGGGGGGGGGEGAKLRYDIRSKGIQWLNDLSKDSETAAWPVRQP